MATALIDRLVKQTGLTLDEWVKYWRAGDEQYLADLWPGEPSETIRIMRNDLAMASEIIGRLKQLVDDFTDETECRYDHHGFCQEHNWMDNKRDCPHKRVKEGYRE